MNNHKIQIQLDKLNPGPFIMQFNEIHMNIP